MNQRVENHYGKSEYHNVADLEARESEGMSLEQRQKREVDFALKASAVELDENSSVLDLACGSGGHSMHISEKTGADIEARDISEPLVEIARRVQREQHVVTPTRREINFQLGDMGNILDEVPEDKKYDLITIFGGSFAFLHRKERYLKALRDYLSLLKKGGKIAIQLRTYDKKMPDTMEQLGVSIAKSRAVAETRDKTSTKVANLLLGIFKNSEDKRNNHIVRSKTEQLVDGKIESCYTTMNTIRGDYFYYIFPEPTIYDESLDPVYDDNDNLIDIHNEAGESVVLTRHEDGRVYRYRDSEGIVIHCFNRVYVDPDGVATEFEANNFDHFIFDAESMIVLENLMREAGFTNTKISCEEIAPSRSVYQVVFVGEK